MSGNLASSRPLRLGTAWLSAVPLTSWLAFCVIAVTLILTSPFPRMFDELEHVSYAAFLQESGRWAPKFESQQTLFPDNLRHWNETRPNYLGHPSPYYLYISLFLDRTLEAGRAVLLPRLASATLLSAALALTLMAARRQFANERLALPVFCLLVALCPKLLAVSSQVTNDALAILGGGLVYWGVSTVDRRRWPGLGAVALGITFALWSKPNAGLAVGTWLGWLILLKAPPRLHLVAAGALGTVVGTIPYWFILHQYGALVPVTVEQFGNVEQLDGFASYLPGFLLNVGSTWSYSQTGTWPITEGSDFLEISLFWAMFACAVWGGLVARGRARLTRDVVGAAGVLAFASVLPIHFWFSATRLGFSLPAASFRYYLPLWPALAHAIAYGLDRARLPSSRALLAGVSLSALALGLLSP